jgi:hypothetical protein
MANCVVSIVILHIYEVYVEIKDGLTAQENYRRKSTPNQTIPMEFISRRLYHKKLYSPMQIFYHGVYLTFLSDLLLSFY